MLNMYQLWLDDLYPRAKFADALAIIEKAGHTKRMQIMRKDWIDEGKPRRSRESDDENVDEVVLDTTEKQKDQDKEDAEREEATVRSDSDSNRHDLPPHQSRSGAELGAGNAPDEDELDALLAESTEVNDRGVRTLPTRPAPPDEDDPFADEMEAIADMDGAWDY